MELTSGPIGVKAITGPYKNFTARHPGIHYATLFIGAIVVNLNPMYTPDELKHGIESTGITTLFTFDRVLANVRPGAREERAFRVIVTRVTDYIRVPPEHGGRTGSGGRMAGLFRPFSGRFAVQVAPSGHSPG